MTLDLIDKKMIARSFGKAAKTYDSVAHFQRRVGASVLSLAPNINAECVLDVGCGTGYFFPDLRQKYQNSRLLGLDLSEQMVHFARNQHAEMGVSWLVGDGEILPIKSHSVDLVFSNLSIQWCGNLAGLFREIKRVLSDQGVFVFSSLLEGTLKELKSAWAQVDSTQHVNEFAQPQDYLTAIEESGLNLDFIDSQLRVLHYDSVNELTRELKQLGAHNMTPHRKRHITGRQRITQFLKAYNVFRREDGTFPASYNVLLGSVSKGEGANL